MILTRYVTRELLPPLLAGVALFTLILTFGYFFVSAQWLGGVPLPLVLRWLGYQLPDTLVKVAPMGVVLMVVVAFGRLSTERELVAVQSGGIGLAQVARPVALIAGGVALLAVWLSLWVAPRLNVEARGLYWDTLTGAGLQQLVGRQLDLGKGLSLSLGGYDRATRELSGVRLERWEGNTQRGTLIFAQHGRFENSTLELRGYSLYTLDYAQIPPAARLLSARPAPDPLTALGALRRVFRQVRLPSPGSPVLRLDTGLSRQQTLAQYADAIGADAQGWSQLTATLRDQGATPAARQLARRELNRKLALPVGNLVLALAALPFALRFGRSLGVSLGIALMIAVAYYLLFVVGITLTTLTPGLPEPGIWLANIVFAGGGLWLLRRA